MTKKKYLWLLIVLAGLSVSSCSQTKTDQFATHPQSGIQSSQIYRPTDATGSDAAACMQMFLLFRGNTPPPQSLIRQEGNLCLNLDDIQTYFTQYWGISTGIFHINTGVALNVFANHFIDKTNSGQLPLIFTNAGKMVAFAGYTTGTAIADALVHDPSSPGPCRGHSTRIRMYDLKGNMDWCSDGYGWYYCGLVETLPTRISGDSTEGGSGQRKMESNTIPGRDFEREEDFSRRGEAPWAPQTFEDTVRAYAANLLVGQNGGSGLTDAGAWFGAQFASGHMGEVIPVSQLTWQPGASALSPSAGPSVYMYVVEIRTEDPSHRNEVVGGIGLKPGYLADSAVFTAVFPFLSSERSEGGSENCCSAVSKAELEAYYGTPAIAFVSEQDDHVALPLYDMPNWLTHDSTGQEVIVDFWGKILTWSTTSKGEQTLVASGETFADVRASVSQSVNRLTTATLGNNMPNPFNPETRIDFSLTQPGQVRIEVFNTLGQKVKALLDEHRLAGNYSVTWDAKDDKGRSVPSGVYFYKLTTGSFTDTKKMVLVK
jgi:hypothetical protein